jgi:trimeric autotransporter adhesin
MKTPHVKSIYLSAWRQGSLVPLVLACFAFSPQAGAVCQQGCDPSNDNTFLGEDALLSDTTGSRNTALGSEALQNNTTGGFNTAIGSQALVNNITGSFNTANGYFALASNITGSDNTANGSGALYSNKGSNNTATGSSALFTNTTGINNTASGSGALIRNTTGSSNTANAVGALSSNSTGFQNTANGVNTLYNNTTGFRNTANGNHALYSNAAGSNNTAEGFQALYYNTGSDNVGLGFNAGNSLTTGSGNVCIGSGVLGVANESNTTRIRNVYASAASGRAVYVNADNKIGTLVSSRRFKEQIEPMDKASEAILALKPVTFHYKKEIESGGSVMFGLIAEDVEKVDPDLVTRNEKGEAETVRYEAVNAMLLNEFLKEHRKVEEQQATITELKKELQANAARQQKQIEALTAGLQKVSAQIEVFKRAPQTVLNNH